jgi:hypothetical protein
VRRVLPLLLLTAVALGAAGIMPAASNADVTSELQEIQGDGGSIAEWYNNVYAGQSGDCDAMCQALGDRLSGTAAQSGTGEEASALGELGEFAEGTGSGAGLLDLGLAGSGIGTAAAAGYLAYKIGEELFGSPATQGPSSAIVVNDTACPMPYASYPGCTQLNGGNSYFGNDPSGGPCAQSFADDGMFGSFLLASSVPLRGPGPFASYEVIPDVELTGYSCAYTGGGFTPEPSSFQATSGEEPGSSPALSPITGGQVMTQLNADPTGQASLIGVIAETHTTVYGNSSGTSTVTDTGTNTLTTATGTDTGGGSSDTGTQTQTQTQTDSDTGTDTGTGTDTQTGTQTDTGTGTGTDTGTGTSPGTSTVTDTGTGTVPAPELDYLTIPAIDEGETTEHYVTRLDDLGFTNVTTHTLTGDEIDLELGPDAAVTVDPHAGTQAQAATAIEVQSNPTDAPAAGSATGSPPPGVTEPGIDLPSVGTPCNVFPFGIPCWLTAQLAAFNAPPVAPDVSISTPASLGGSPLDVNLGSFFGVNSSVMMDVFREVLLAASFIGLVMWLGGMAMGGGPDGGSDGGGEG